MKSLREELTELRNCIDYQRLFGISEFESQIPQSFSQLHQNVVHCSWCGRSQERTASFLGEGNNDADIFFIEENFLPCDSLFFDNEAAALFLRILKSIGFTKDKVYLAALVKCRVEQEYIPSFEERKPCLKHLAAQIMLVNPKIICTFGELTAQTLLDTSQSIDQLSGNKFFFKGIQIVPTYHPSTLIVGPEKKKAVWEDMKRILTVAQT